MSGLLALYETRQYFSNAGAPLAGGKVYTYTAGTSTPALTYTNQALSVPNTNPIILDSAGRCVIYLDPTAAYKFIVKDSSDVTIWTQDNISYASTAPTQLSQTANRVRSTVTGTNNNFDVNALSTVSGLDVSYLEWNGASNATFTGIIPARDGQTLWIQNIRTFAAPGGSTTLTLSNLSSSSSAANRMNTLQTDLWGDIVLSGQQWAFLIYDGAASNWNVLYASRPVSTLVSKTPGTIYQAKQEGAVSFIGDGTGGASGTVELLVGFANPPTTTLAKATFVNTCVTASGKIASGMYYKGVSTTSAGSPVFTMQNVGD